MRLALVFVLILRGRYLSARNPEPASPVETWHPPMHSHYSKTKSSLQVQGAFLTNYLDLIEPVAVVLQESDYRIHSVGQIQPEHPGKDHQQQQP